MTEDITSLQIRILYDSVDKAESRLRNLEQVSTKTKKSIEGLGSGASAVLNKLLALAGGVGVVATSIHLLKSIVETTAQFQQLNAQLITATGSAENAAAAFEAIKDFATQTPYDLQQATNAFISLVNRGLTPSERALRAYGDTASSMGASLSDMVLAVSNATAGEYENLKRFGIRAEKLGDTVTFTFRGIKTEVKNSINEIEKYFIELGEKNFGGGMARQMDTLNGKISNLADAWDVLKATIGEAGLGDVVKGILTDVTNLVAEITAQIESGQVQAEIDAWGAAFEGYVTDVRSGLEMLNDLFNEHSKAGQETGNGLYDNLSNSMQGFLLVARANIQSAAVALHSLVDAAVDIGAAITETLSAAFDTLVTLAWETGKAMGNALNPFSEKSAIDGFKEAFANVENAGKEGAERVKNKWADTWDKLKINAQDSAAQVNNYQKEVTRTVEQSIAEQAEAAARREKLDADFEKRAKDRSDRLAKYRTGEGSTVTGGKDKKSGRKSSEQSEWEALEKSLLDQETLISRSYARRLELIKKNTREGSEYQAQLELSLTDKWEEEQMRRLDKLKEAPETMFEAFAEEERILQESYDRRKEIILSATEVTEAEKLRMLREAEQQHTAAMRKHETERNKEALGLAADFFGNLSQIASVFGKKGSKIAKAAAIAQTTIKTYEGATSAYSSLAGIPIVGPALGAAAAAAAIAAGLANVARIKNADDSYSGAYAIGGLIPPGKVGLVGEAGPELVRGPALVTSAQSTWDRMGGAANGGNAPSVEVNIVNLSGEPVTERRSQQGDRQLVEFIIGKAREGVANDIAKGGTGVAKALESTYNLTRGRRA
jgi:hypothetical protein